MKIRPCSALNRGVVRRHTSLTQRALASLVGALLGMTLLFFSVQTPASEPQLPSHQNWSLLLNDCVLETSDGQSTAVDYACFDSRRPELQRYLQQLSAYDQADYDKWDADTQLAFLINAYNAWTVDLILSAWPDLDSIRDLGSLIRSPWKKTFIALLGDELSLDDIEHGLIREPGVFDDPRIHFAVNCASIGCPALRREAYQPSKLQAQLEEQTQLFLNDSSRNRLRDGRLEVSSIFKWYRDDFEQNWRDLESLEQFLASYAPSLKLSQEDTQALRAGNLPLTFLDYDWRLNAPGARE